MELGYIYWLGQENLIKINLKEFELCETAPEMEIAINYHEQNMPISMGGFNLGSEIILIGGEKRVDGYDWAVWPVKDIRFGHRGISSFVYTFNPAGDIIKGDIPPMNGPKTCPVVSKIDGKFYVLATHPDISSWRDLEGFPVFEVYDPSTKSCESLPMPEIYDYGLMSSFFGFHRFLFLTTIKESLVFDVDSKEWRRNGDGIGNAVFFRGLCSRGFGNVVRYRDVVIGYGHSQGLVAYLIDADMRPVCCKELLELRNYFYDFSMGYVYRLESDMFCLSCTGDTCYGNSIYVSIFAVDLYNPGDSKGESFNISIRVLRSHFYLLDEIPDLVRPYQAPIVVYNDSNKLSLGDEWVDDYSSKKPRIIH